MNRQLLRNTSPCRILLVEDNPELAEVTAEFIRLEGAEVRIAQSGQQALEIAEAFGPEIVLCDMRLPDMAGLDVLQALRSRESGKDALLVIYSALSEFDLRLLKRTVDESTVDVFLSKPINVESLNMLLTRRQGFRRRA